MRFEISRQTLFSRIFFRLNIAIGLTITLVALYLIFTGDYPSHQTRQASEAVLNRFAIGGLIYMGVVWSACQFGKPFMKDKTSS